MQVKITEEEKMFLRMIYDPVLREDLQARLERLGLLSAFLEVESETSE